MRKILCALLLAACPLAFAQSVSSQAVLTWSAPTTYTSSNQIAAGTVITYTVYQGAKAGADFSRVTQVTDTTATVPYANATPCFYVTATIAGVESDPSSTVCAVQPSKPGDLKLEIHVSVTN